MKNQLITLLKMCHTLDWTKDRTGVYSLRNVNKFPKFGRVARTAAVAPPRASLLEPAPQPSLFEGAKAPGTPPPQNLADRTDRTDRTKQAAPPPKAGKNSEESQGSTESRPTAPSLAKAGFLQPAKSKLKVLLAAAAAFVPKSVARLRGRWFTPPADARPRAQAELALEKVKVMRNDLTDADLVVVAVQAKPEEPCAARAEGREPAANPWTRVAARWIKLKIPADGGSPASAAPLMPAARPVALARTPPLNPC